MSGPRWEYRVCLAKWIDIGSGRVGYPSKGDWYCDAGEWRIW